jgi:hypothetical protein
MGELCEASGALDLSGLPSDDVHRSGRRFFRFADADRRADFASAKLLS